MALGVYALKMIRRYFDLKVEINQLDTGEVLHATTEARLLELVEICCKNVSISFSLLKAVAMSH